MKLRQKPEDFIVEEINDFEISRHQGSYKLYLLEKRGIETFFLLSYLSKNNNIPLNELGIAGMKDKHAKTRQYMTVPSKYNIKTLNEQNMKISFLGYVSKKLNLGDLKGNKFEITVRDLSGRDIEGIEAKAKSLESFGVPNYFDSQRFGSVINHNFIARYAIKKNYEQAVKIYLTQFTRHEKQSIKQEKRLIEKNWESLRELKVNSGSLRRIVGELKKTNNWLGAYKKIPFSLREMFNSAYQSYIWNECIKELMREKLPKSKIFKVKYNAGTLLFYKELNETEYSRLGKSFKTVCPEIKPSIAEKKALWKVLGREGISTDDFNIKNETGNFFAASEREVILKPSQLKISHPERDELNDKGKSRKFRITLFFSLPKGSYATLITKGIFGR